MSPATAWLWCHNHAKNKKKYCTVYHIALNSKREAQKTSKNLKKMLGRD
jgi:hypothetical protein